MGRRSINTTKSGKYMNPTDQARKEARKRELKKNKKQRQMVRAAVLKGKDPAQIIMEMEKMDQMEFCVEGQPLLSEKVLKDKRKKLRETLDRVLKLYEKEDPEYWVEIRRMESEYEKKRLALIEYFESVRHAQAVTIDEIPLPNLDMPGGDDDDDDEHDMLMQEEVISVPPIPNAHLIPSHGILKKPPIYIPPVRVEAKDPPGCPPTLPPDFSDDEDEEKSAGHVLEKEKDKKRTITFKDVQDSDDEDERKDDDKGDSDDDGNDDEDDDDDDDPSKTNKSLTNLQTKLLQMSGQDIDDFMRETEVLFREKEAERKADLIARLDGIKDDDEPINLTVPPPGITQMKSGVAPVPPPGIPPRIDVSVPQGVPTSQTGPLNVTPAGASGSASHGAGPPTGPGAPVMPLQMPANPVVPPGIGLVPPVVPPGIAPPLLMRPPPSRPGMPPPLGIRLPPGLPPQGLPPRLSNMRLPPPVPLRPTIRPPGGIPTIPPPGLPPRLPPPGHNPNVLSAGPQLIARPREDEKKSSATIEAKPQIRSNLSADVTRFLPTALRVKREDKKKASKTATADTKEFPGTKQEETDRKPTKDDAYSQFMKEMEGLL